MLKKTKKNKNTQKKSSLVYISGTGTVKESPVKHLKLNTFKKLGYKVSVSDGVGTIAGVKQEKKLHTIDNNDPLENNSGNLFRNLMENVTAIRNMLLGYREDTHLVQSNAVFEALDNDPKKMVLAGHSRGAAVGLTGIITQLYTEAILAKENGLNADQNFLANLDKIAIVALDPVMGLNTNDHIGLNKAIDSDTPSISEMLNTISEAAKKPDLFDVTVVLARHDGRKNFKIDPRWEEFSDQNSGKKCDIYHTSFHHSDMVFDPELKNKNLPIKEHTMTLDIYDPVHKPIELVHAILAEKLLPENTSLKIKQQHAQNVSKMAKQIQEVELKEITKIKNNQPSRLTKYTSSEGLSGIRAYLVTGDIKKDLEEGNLMVHGREIEAKNNIRTEEQKRGQSEPKFILPERTTLKNDQNQEATNKSTTSKKSHENNYDSNFRNSIQQSLAIENKNTAIFNNPIIPKNTHQKNHKNRFSI